MGRGRSVSKRQPSEGRASSTTSQSAKKKSNAVRPASKSVAARAAAAATPPRSQKKRAAGVKATTKATPAKQASSTEHYEFGGPIGAAAITVALPALVWWIAHFCSSKGWPNPPLSWPLSPQLLPQWRDVAATVDLSVFAVYVAWFGLQLLLHLMVPGRLALGTVLPDGTRLQYKINGWRCFLLTHVIIAALHVSGVLDITWIYRHYVQLATSAILFSTLLSVYLYAASFSAGAALAPGGNTGMWVYDFFIGRELNPRVTLGGLLPAGTLDLKYFCELRPGLFLWHLINVAMVLEQYSRHGSIPLAMWIVLVSQAMYIADAVLSEESILTTIDITTDGFGFMLSFGDLAWLPFMYSLQSRFLVDFPQELSPAYAALCTGAVVIGLLIFRSANAQKDMFKKNPMHPAVKGLKCVPTATGSRLLADSWWGVSRHINYFGDWLLSLGMSLPTGAVTPITYFYPVYFAVLLIHREMRDEHKCAAKYGEAWKEYKRLVPYRIVPFVY